MSTYVWLTSNASLDIYPENHGGSFRTKLKRDLMLNSNYEVGLVEFQYVDNSWASVNEEERFIEVQAFDTYTDYLTSKKVVEDGYFTTLKYERADLQNFKNPEGTRVTEINYNIGMFPLSQSKFGASFKIKLESLFIDDVISQIIHYVTAFINRYLEHYLHDSTISDFNIQTTITDEDWSVSFPAIELRETNLIIRIAENDPELGEIIGIDQESFFIPSNEAFTIHGEYSSSYLFSKKRIEELETAKRKMVEYNKPFINHIVKLDVGKGYSSIKEFVDEIVDTINDGVNASVVGSNHKLELLVEQVDERKPLKLGVKTTNFDFVIIKASPQLFNLLGFSESQLNKGSLEVMVRDFNTKSINEFIISKRAPTLMKDLDTLWIYSDCVTESLVGNQEAKLLGIIPVQHNQRDLNGTVRVFYDKPHYLNLSHTNISNVEIAVFDSFGMSPIIFRKDVIVKLHFRLKRNQ